MAEPVTVEQIIKAGWPAAESHDAAERPERARAILALFEPSLKELDKTVDRMAETRGLVRDLTTALKNRNHENAALKARVGELEIDAAAHVCTKIVLNRVCAQLADAERVTGLARKLASEVTGIIGLAEMELRRAVGNSNVNALAHRLDAFQAALTPAKEPRDGN